MKKLVIIKPLELTSTYGNQVKTTIQVGKLEFEVILEKNDEKVVLTKPDKLKTLEEAGVELDYQPILDQYDAIVSNLDEFRATAKERKLRHKYQNSEVVKMDLPTIDGAEIRLETEEEYTTKEGGSVSDPDIYVTIGGFTSTIRYRDTDRSSWRSSNNRMRFVVDNAATENKSRQYSTLRACVNKLLVLVPQYLEAEKARKNSKVAAEEREAKRVEYILANFPNAVKEKYGKQYHVEVNGKEFPINAQSKDGEFIGFTLKVKGSYSDFPVSKDQLNNIIKILSNEVKN